VRLKRLVQQAPWWGAYFFPPHPLGLAEQAICTWNLKVQPWWSEVFLEEHASQLLSLASEFVVFALLQLIAVGGATAGKVPC